MRALTDDRDDLEIEWWIRSQIESPLPAESDEKAHKASFDRNLLTAAAVVYVIAGLWMLYGADFAIGDALARASSARSIAHSRDQHLMAAGFYWAPGPVFAQAPFMAVFSRVGRPELAIVLPTVAATVATLALLLRLARQVDAPERWARGAIAIFAFNPYTIFFAGSGMSEPWYAMALAGISLSYLRWSHRHRYRDLGLLALWLAMGQTVRHENVAVVAAIAAIVAWQSAPRRRVATAVAVVLPTAFYVLVWTAVSIAIIRKPFWRVITDDNAAAGGLTNRVLAGDHSATGVLSYTIQLCLRMAPVLVVAAIGAGLVREVKGQFRRSRRPALHALPLVLIGGVFPGQIFLLLLSQNSFGDPRYYTPLIIVAAVLTLIALAARVPSGGPHGRWPGVLLTLSVFGSITGFATLADARLSSVTGEAAVARRLFNRDEDGVSGRGRTDQWRDFTAALDSAVGPSDRVVLDSATAHPVFLFTKNPTQTSTERDKDTEALLQRVTPPFTVAVLAPGGRTAVSSGIRTMIQSTAQGRRWERIPAPEVGWNFGSPEIWKLVQAPTDAPSASQTNSSPSTTRRVPSASTTVPPATQDSGDDEE